MRIYYGKYVAVDLSPEELMKMYNIEIMEELVSLIDALDMTYTEKEKIIENIITVGFKKLLEEGE